MSPSAKLTTRRATRLPSSGICPKIKCVGRAAPHLQPAAREFSRTTQLYSTWIRSPAQHLLAKVPRRLHAQPLTNATPTSAQSRLQLYSDLPQARVLK